MASINIGKNVFECTTCEKSFSRKSDLNRHISMTKNHTSDSVHEETKTFKCKKCDKGLTRKYCLKKHMAGVHAPGKLPSKCNICNASFADAQYLNIHINDVHTKRTVYKATPSRRQMALEKRKNKK
jgi:KRAB domain-containing zinc finger protein